MNPESQEKPALQEWFRSYQRAQRRTFSVTIFQRALAECEACADRQPAWFGRTGLQEELHAALARYPRDALDEACALLDPVYYRLAHYYRKWYENGSEPLLPLAGADYRRELRDRYWRWLYDRALV